VAFIIYEYETIRPLKLVVLVKATFKIN